MSNLEKFKELGLSDQMIDALAKKGFEEPTEIQSLSIPFLLNETKDILAQARTGTGKTGSFAIPIIEKISHKNKIQAVILAPTRELALQITEEINSISQFKNLITVTIYGGQPIDRQISRLRRGADIAVATPGRIIDHLQKGTIDLSNAEYLVLDEADEMLNMGFIEDIENIISYMPKKKRVLLFSATMPTRIISLAKKYMGEYEILSAKNTKTDRSNIKQIYFEVNEYDKFEALFRVIDLENSFYGVVFCRTKSDSDDIAEKLRNRNLRTEAIHGDISQAQREKTLARFKRKDINILVATDVAARGIDVSDLTHVVNYSLPMEAESYTHRIGRTGRAGKTGTAITLITPSEFRKLMYIKKSDNHDITKEDIPEIDKIISIKKQQIIAQIDELIDGTTGDLNHDMIEGLLERHKDTKIIIAALLRKVFKNDLDPDKYKKLAPIRRKGESSTGGVKLFVAKGKNDSMNPEKIISLIGDDLKISGNRINDIRILDDFSFISVSKDDSYLILDHFSAQGGRSIVSKAKERSDNNSFGGGGGNRRGPGRSFGGGQGGRGGFAGKSNFNKKRF
jgi:ATP-dependent RNA helicase DeaD